MIKAAELIVVFILLIFSFFTGVKYSDSVKSRASWLFEIKDEQEVELPDLSNESGIEISPSVNQGENSYGDKTQPQNQEPITDEISPAESKQINP